MEKANGGHPTATSDVAVQERPGELLIIVGHDSELVSLADREELRTPTHPHCDVTVGRANGDIVPTFAKPLADDRPPDQLAFDGLVDRRVVEGCLATPPAAGGRQRCGENHENHYEPPHVTIVLDGSNTLGSAMTRIDEFDYELPQERIAQVPLADRSSSRLLVDRGTAAPDHRTVADLDQILRPGDLLVVNDTKVLAARLFARRPTGGRTEVLLLEPVGPAAVALHSDVSEWEVLVKPSKKVPPGTELTFDDELDLHITIGEDMGEGRRRARIESSSLEGALSRAGEMPLPPYITETLDDPDRYQTVYAQQPGSAAAPTAGLHLTNDLFERLATAGVGLARVELIVGLDTFRPVAVHDLDDHHMHSERYRVPAETLAAVERAERVVAVGTTTVRALESAARFGPEGATDLFIRYPFDFETVDLMMTNFHMPKSTLLVMIDAFVGARWRDLYAEALASNYRFLSFGDAMLLDRTAP